MASSENIDENSFLKCTYRTCPLYLISESASLLTGIKLAQCTPMIEQNMYCIQKSLPVESFPETIPENLTVSDRMMCSVCCTAFKDRYEQRQHYKLDWHRFNLKRKLMGKPPCTEIDFNSLIAEISSLSSSNADTEDSECDSNDTFSCPKNQTNISVLPTWQKRIRKESIFTDTDDDTDDAKGTCRLQPKIYLQNNDGQIIALYRSVVHGKKNIPESEKDLIQLVFDVLEQLKWAIILIGGGHFASAIFNKGKISVHKTFHRYTVRSKQGSCQNIRDNKHGGHQPKSAGASLRRSNELSLVKDIQELLNSWSKELQECHRIFYRAPNFNRLSLFSSKNPPFRKGDCRLRTIPFPTRRATFKEVQRVFELLIKIECFGNKNEINEAIPRSPKVHLGSKSKQAGHLIKCPAVSSIIKRGTENDKYTEEDLSGDSSEIINQQRMHTLKKEIIVLDTSSKRQNDPVNKENNKHFDNYTLDEPCAIEYEMSKETVSFEHLKEFEICIPRRSKKVSRKKTRKRQQDPEDNNYSKEKSQMKNALYTACKSGDIQTFKFILIQLKNPYQILFTNLHSLQINCLGEYCLKEESCSSDQATEEVNVSPKDFASSDVEKIPKEVGNDLLLEFDERNQEMLFDTSVIQKSSAELKPEKNMELGISGLSLQDDNSISSSLIIDKNLTSVAKFEHFLKPAPQRRHSITVPDFETCNQFHMLENCLKMKYSCSTPSSPQLKHKKHQTKSKAVSPIPLTMSMINEPINDSGTTLLHLAAKEGHQEIVSLLLNYGADPTIKEKLGNTPYMLSKNREVRKSFRHFMACNPEMHDYNKAQIPSPLTEEMERRQAERRKERKKYKKKNIQSTLMNENSLEQHSKLDCSPMPICCCFQCALDLKERIPFECNGNYFCSIQCVKEHKKKFG